MNDKGGSHQDGDSDAATNACREIVKLFISRNYAFLEKKEPKIRITSETV